MTSAATCPNCKCGAINPSRTWGKVVCEKPKGHSGAHVSLQPNASIAWGGMT